MRIGEEISETEAGWEGCGIPGNEERSINVKTQSGDRKSREKLLVGDN